MARRSDFVLAIAASALAVLYGASFLPGLGGRYAERPSQTAVLNSRRADSVSRLVLEQADGRIVLTKDADSGIWLGRGGGNEFPLDEERMARFFEKLQAIRRWYPVSDGTFGIEGFGLSEGEAFFLSYVIGGEGGEEVRLAIGASDFSKTMRFVQAGGGTEVFRMEVDFDEFLRTEPRYWYDPYLIPRSLFSDGIGSVSQVAVTYGGKSSYVQDVPRLYELRHGALCQRVPEGGPVLSLSVNTATGGKVSLEVRPHESGDYSVSYRAAHGLEYSALISAWTYGSLREILGVQ